MNTTEYVTNGSGVGEERGAINAMLFRDVESPRKERVIDNASDGGGSVLVFPNEVGEGS